MRIALLQSKQNELYDFAHKDKKHWKKEEIQKLQNEMVMQNIELIEQAAMQQADLAVTSEAVNYAGSAEMYEGNYKELIMETQDQFIEQLQLLAKKRRIALVAGLYRVIREPSTGELIMYNSSFFWDKNGNLLGIYDKIHRAGSEKLILTAGREYPVFDTEYGRIGICICWDMQFPECARIMALKDADLVVCPTWGWEAVYGHARAYENGIYIAAAMGVPYEAEISGIRNPSEVIHPDGTVLCTGSRNSSETVICDVNLSDCKSYRSLRMGDRMPETYLALV